MIFVKSSLLLGVVVFLVTQSHSLIPQQQVTKNDYKGTEIEWSLLVNQVALLRLLNESSTSCSLHECELQEMRELMNELQEFKKTALSELQNLTMASINKINAKNEEARQVNETALNVSQQAAIITTTPPLECEDSWSEYQSSCYKVFKKSVTFWRAVANCRDNGAYVASIASEGENSFLAGLIETGTIIGLSDADQEGVYTWQDGSPFNFSKWYRDEPNSGDYGDCVFMFTSSYWHDYHCGTPRPYICEKRIQ